MDDIDLQYIIDHIFLPPKLPQKHDPDTHRKDGILLEYVVGTSKTFADTLAIQVDGNSPDNLQAWNIILKMLNTMSSLYADGGIFPKELQHALKQMDVADVLPVFIEAQNAGIIFRKITQEVLTFEAFEVSLSSEVVMGTCGKILMRFPTNPPLPLPAEEKVLSTLANVLAHLSTSSMEESMAFSQKGGESHHEVRNTASPRFITEALAGIIRATPPRTRILIKPTYIHKRINDHVLWKSALRPWRRSSMWLLIRVALQTTLEQSNTHRAGGYKAFQAFLVASLLDRAASGNPDRFPCDLLGIMNAKLVRRLCKLGDIIEDDRFLTLQMAKDAVSRASSFRESMWKQVQRDHGNIEQWNPPSSLALGAKACLAFSFPESQNFFLGLSARHKSLKTMNEDFDLHIIEANLRRSLPSRTSLSPTHLPSLSEEIVEETLYEFETWVETCLQKWQLAPVRSETDCLRLSSVIDRYREIASRCYEGDPERISLMHLCILELWVALDGICGNWCPLLHQYSPEIAQNVAEPLILPYLGQMKRLEHVELYLLSRHAKSRDHGARSVFRQVKAAESFQNQYFDYPTAKKLIKLEQRILKDSLSGKADTLSKLRKGNGDYDRLMQQAGALECSTFPVTTRGVRTWQHMKKRCPKCQLLKEARGLKVPLFEDPLPENILLSRPIVFELQCPPPFASWRDATMKIIRSVLGEEKKPHPELYPLQTYEPLKSYFEEPYPGFLLSLASSSKSLKRSHYGKERAVPALESQVLFKHKGDFDLFDAIDNRWLKIGSGDTLRPTCTFQADGKYASLQIFVNDTRHTPNSVLASISKCPLGISPTEYVTFGLLRAGHRLQWRNLMRAMRSHTLSFAEPGVFALTLQSIWQAGPVDEVPEGGVSHESHIDLLDEEFGTQVANELLRNVRSLGSNWKQTSFLAILVLLCLRIQAFTPHASVRVRTQSILSEVRKRSTEWIKIIQKAHFPAKNQDAVSASQESDCHIRQALANVAVVLRASFDVEGQDYANVFALRCDAVIYVYTTILISGAHVHSFPPPVDLLASRNRRTALRLEQYLLAACGRTPSILQEIMRLGWPHYSMEGSWSPVSSCDNRWWRSSRIEAGLGCSQTLHMDVIDGTLLIDGAEFDHLPSTYVSHAVYATLFKDYVFRAVCKSQLEEMGMRYQGYYQDHEVHFGMIEQRLIVIHREDTQIYEYIPIEILEEYLPTVLSANHFFWYSKSTNSIEIRPLSQAWVGGGEWDWAIHLEPSEAGRFSRVERVTPSGRQNLVQPDSEVYRCLTRALSPLEPDPRGLFVTVSDHDTSIISVHLPRHDLGFSLRQNNLECISQPGYVVDASLDGIGCLFGLKSIVNLRHSDLSQPSRKLIVPKGSMVVTPGRYGHVQISIDIGDSKGYFVYEADQFVGRLVGTRTMESDLYLAKLHAFTASSMPDPLTQRTGTIEALDRLASSASFSFYGVSKESRSYLDEILNLTPLRSFYPLHLRVMETVEWNRHLPVCAQHSQFRSKVELILSSWKDMEIFHEMGDLARKPDAARGLEYLTYRATHRELMYAMDPTRSPSDLVYEGRDSLNDSESRERESTAFKVASMTHNGGDGFPTCRSLRDIIMQWKQVAGKQSWEWDSVSNWLCVPSAAPIADIWCTLYELCRRTESPSFDASVALAFQGFRGVSLELVASFGAVLYAPMVSSPTLECPSFSPLKLDDGHVFDRSAILSHLRSHKQPFSESRESTTAMLFSENQATWSVRARNLYQSALEMECETVLDELDANWPANPERSLTSELRLLEPAALIMENTIRPLLVSWAENRKFLLHIDAVQTELGRVRVPRPPYVTYIPLYPRPILNPAKFRTVTLEKLMAERAPGPSYSPTMEPLHIPSKMPNDQEISRVVPLLERVDASARNMLQKNYANNLRSSFEAYQPDLTQATDGHGKILDQTLFKSFQSITSENNRAYLQNIQQCLGPDTEASRLMQLVGLWPTITTLALLQCLSLGNRRALSDSWVQLLVGYAVGIHDIKRAGRILQLAGASMNTLIDSELRYSRVWKPLDHPDWLLVEIDANISVRPVQATIAQQMLEPDGDENTVMQLNMGEGKSSVIVPIVAASASIGSNISRVVVLGSQLKQQFQILRRTVTGLCDRRIIYLPFHRKLRGHLNPAQISQIHEYLRKGAAEGAIWICEPEHLLSLKLLGLDLAAHCGSRDLIGLHSWLHNHTKDILDESDEILHARQQVVYTVGGQQPLDSSPARWEIIQKLLGLLVAYLEGNSTTRDLSSFLIKTEPMKSTCTFPEVRIRSDAASEHLQDFIIESLWRNDWSLPRYMITAVVDFVTSPCPSTGLRDCSDEDEHVMQTILILRGMITCKILMHTLKEKRWRVHYGLDLQRSRLAIPFRAKDSPSPRSEFGHPDVTILLTCLSYYYRGLDLEMLTHMLKSLLSSEAPDITYAEWLKPDWNGVPPALRTIKGLDLQDQQLLERELLPHLQYNKTAIDFYLNTFVFPGDAKEFPSKMSSSGWDIAITKPNPTTGFSGTNDGRLLLPVTITQTDRDGAQLHTNAKVLSLILQRGNSSIEYYPNFIKSPQLLKRIRKLASKPTVILDVGAQILDLSNADFARTWLGMYRDDPTIKAAVFFDESSNLLVLGPDGDTQPFIDSPYSNRLDQCLVYLDEVHTRGTDLRIPETQAVVTLGPKLNKDKLVQGCMRMRRLGHGHTLLFMASTEVLDLISLATGSNNRSITVEDVIHWSIMETWKQMQADLPAWVLQGHSFVRREAAWRDLSQGRFPLPSDVSRNFCEPEARSLVQLYGVQSTDAPHWIRKKHSPKPDEEIIRKIVQRCQDFDPFTVADAGVHEEMEIELVHEMEMEREVQRVPEPEPAQHALHPNVERFVSNGAASLLKGKGFLTAAEAFVGTSLEAPAGFDEVFSNIRVTEDFWRTVKRTGVFTPGSVDSFMREVHWVVTIARSSNRDFMVLFSPYEANQLLPKFRISTDVKLHMFSPRSNLATPSFEDLDFLTLPSSRFASALPRPLAMQLNLFSGSLYFRDYLTYIDVCQTLRLHFGPLPEHLAKPSIITANFFVMDPKARLELGMNGLGFDVNALPFFRNMICMRRFGRGFGPSHMGKILERRRLKEEDFVGDAYVEEDVHMSEE